MKKQLELFNIGKGMRRAKRGIAAATRAADKTVLDAVEQAIMKLSESLEFLTVDDLWAAVPGLMTRLPKNAIGGLFQKAARAGVIADAQRSVKSARPSRRACKVSVWRCLLHKPVSAAA